MKNDNLLKNILQIYLITCNRSALLDNTLRQFKDSPFAVCRFTVLDNCSTDDTPKVTSKYQEQFPDYHVIRHNRNIGGDANYLRAIEISTSVYTWVVCDDDNYNFADCSDLISAISSCKYDLIYVGSRSPVHLGWTRYGETSAKNLVNGGARYHRACSFWPALIFKTQLFEDKFFHNAPYMFPSIWFINKSINQDFKIYVSKTEIVIRYEGSPMESSPLSLYKEWATNVSKISDTKIRRSVIDQCTDKGFLRTLGFWIAIDKSKRTPGLFKRYIDIIFVLTAWQKAKFLLLLPFLFVPLPINLLICMRKIAYKMMGSNDLDQLPPIESEGR